MVDIPIVSSTAPADNGELVSLPVWLIKEKGMPNIGVAIWRSDRSQHCYWKNSVGNFLLRSENQSGTWLIDGGWGGPPGPIHVRWNGESWDFGDYCGARFKH